MKREEKDQAVTKAQRWLADCKVAIVTDYRGMTVSEMAELRRQLRVANVEYHVVKNNLAALAAERVGKGELKNLLVGPSAIAFGYGEVSEPPRIIAEYVRSAKVPLTIRGGVLDKRLLSASEVNLLATLPPREVLLGRLLGQMQAPISSLLSVLTANLAGLVRVLQARGQQLEGG
ncbi:MAG: 50S ribosomal protein L10 [Chloroflexi bacterium]|nr:MAG: 50S ribosomal protein L10 [Chloroflexota bacterium]RLC95240.1 MAG: 50S ribosomal protein L10 [Chloroflexota bacterium]